MASITLTLPEALKRAIAAYNDGKFSEAERLCHAIIATKRDFFEALHLLAIVQTKLGCSHDALASYDRALTIRPDHPPTLNNRGSTLGELKRFEEALASYDRALALHPDFPEALSNRGNILRELKRFEEALASYDRALTLQPDYPEALSNRGLALCDLRRFQEGLACYDRALKLRPDYAVAHHNEGMCRLMIGDFDRGWEKREWKSKNWNDFAQPMWLGSKNADKAILLHARPMLGFGDTIQFCRYVPLVAERAARVILEVQASLRGLMSTLAGVVQIVASGESLPNFDLHCSLLSLPLAFRTRLETIPCATPYLRVSSQAMMNWNARLGSRGHPRIGLAWSGNPFNLNDHNRSIKLRSLLSLLDLDATFISLQKDVRAGDAAVLKAHSDVLHFGDELKDFSDTAAIISNLDLIISVDTSVVHLAGALAKPVWVMLPFIPDWRWLLDREDSPWYPTARLFRQDDSRTWENVIVRVHAALQDFVRHYASTRTPATRSL